MIRAGSRPCSTVGVSRARFGSAHLWHPAIAPNAPLTGVTSPGPAAAGVLRGLLIWPWPWPVLSPCGTDLPRSGALWIGMPQQQGPVMPLDHWLAFVAASAVLLAIPGPTVLLVVSYALGHGRKAALATVSGIALGDLTAMTASMLGLGAVLMTSGTIFTALRWIGGAYLIYLGIRLWRAPVGPTAVPAAKDRGWRLMMGHAYAVTA